MSVSRGLVLTALCAMSLGLILPASSSAQVYEAARRSLDLSPDPIARSPRLLGMGRLTLADDPHNRLGMWDFAGNPLGVLEADSVSTFDLRPATASAAGKHTPVGLGRERQYLASREVRLGFEAWRRTESGNAYGFIGDAANLRTDRPFSDDSEIRGTFREPAATGILNGKMPYFQSERMRYAFTATYSSENQIDQYRTLFSNAAGDYLGRKGDVLPPPDFFTPDEYRISTLGGAAGLSYRLASWSNTAVVFHARSSRIEGENSSVIHDSGTGEDRPYYGIQATETGRAGPIDWIYDVQSWKSASEDRWVFTLKAGLNQVPFAGRGKLLDREETGLVGRGRVRWVAGKLTLGGSIDHGSRTVEITPPDIGDRTSFNYFRNVAAHRDGADSLAIPDSVVYEKAEETYWGAAGGATWALGHGSVGFEYHYAEQKLVQTLAGEGPQRRIWDVRTGLEYSCTPVLSGRLGYLFRDDDRDLLTQRNEFTSHSVTLGLGLMPRGAIWGFDLGYAIEWLRPTFDSADDPSESRQPNPPATSV